MPGEISPKLNGYTKKDPADPATLAAGRYGTRDMVEIWGAERTFEFQLTAQAESARVISELYPDIVPLVDAQEIIKKANLKYVSPERIRELEAEGEHDIIALNTALQEVLEPSARRHINKAKTSADTTQPARAMQIKRSLEVIADTTENLRDIAIEKSFLWIDTPHMDTSHLYDALPSVAGRAFSHYAETLQSGLKVLKFFYENSVMGKWGDATGNHHGAKALGMDGILLQEKYCEALGVNFMDASAQIPALEFEADIMYSLARIGETINNIAKYIAWGRSDDVGVFVNTRPKKVKGSSGMPHKDKNNGNPTSEEQNMSLRNYLVGNLMTAMMNCEFPYARNLAGSANSRINLEDGFKFMDHAIRRLAGILYWIELREDRCIERVYRSYGVVTSPQILQYLTDQRRTNNPMEWRNAHDLLGKLAKKAWSERREFYQVLREDKEITSRIEPDVLARISSPEKYIGESRRIIELVRDKYYKTKTLDV